MTTLFTIPTIMIPVMPASGCYPARGGLHFLFSPEYRSARDFWKNGNRRRSATRCGKSLPAYSLVPSVCRYTESPSTPIPGRFFPGCLDAWQPRRYRYCGYNNIHNLHRALFRQRLSASYSFDYLPVWSHSMHRIYRYFIDKYIWNDKWLQYERKK